jgi:hypothetical protein
MLKLELDTDILAGRGEECKIKRGRARKGRRVHGPGRKVEDLVSR